MGGAVNSPDFQSGRRGPWSPEDIRDAMLVYAVTDRAWLNGRSLADCVRQAIEGGATFVQLREKDAPRDEIVIGDGLFRILQNDCGFDGVAAGAGAGCRRAWRLELAA